MWASQRGQAWPADHTFTRVATETEHGHVTVQTAFCVQGQACWQGPARSIRVDLTCGPVTKLTAVDEPSRCTYTAAMMTPALCSPSAITAVKAALREFGSEAEAPPADAGPPREDL